MNPKLNDAKDRSAESRTGVAAQAPYSEIRLAVVSPRHAHDISDDSEDASATGEAAAGFNPSPEDAGILLEDDTRARQ